MSRKTKIGFILILVVFLAFSVSTLTGNDSIPNSIPIDTELQANQWTSVVNGSLSSNSSRTFTISSDHSNSGDIEVRFVVRDDIINTGVLIPGAAGMTFNIPINPIPPTARQYSIEIRSSTTMQFHGHASRR